MIGGKASETRGRLAIVAPTAFLFGGVQTWLDYLVPGLEALGWRVTVLLVHGIHSDAHRYLSQHPFSTYRFVESRTGSREGRIRALCDAIDAVDADLVLAVNIVDVFEAVARLRRRNTAPNAAPKVAMALHALHSSFYDDIRCWAGVLDGVIATNRLAAAAAVRWGGLPADRVHYAPGGVSISEVDFRSSTAEPLTLLFAGRFESAEKRVMDLPSILRELVRLGLDFRVKLAGSGPDEEELRHAMAEFGHRVEFLGVLNAIQMGAIFFRPGAVALVLSPSETGPLFAWEALANSVTLVTSRFLGIGLEDSLRDGETCLSFPVGDVESAAAAIARLADPVLREQLARAGHELVRQRYSLNASIQAWDTAAREIGNHPARGTPPSEKKLPGLGRLDRVLGTSAAESVRSLLGMRFLHTEPGGEWPHSYGTDDNGDFRQFLTELDRAADSAK